MAFLQIFFGPLAMFFILVHGWDGTGYRRFFSATKSQFLDWTPSNVLAWFTSDVALTLYVLGVFLIPLLVYVMSAWIVRGARAAQADDESMGGKAAQWRVAEAFLETALLASLGSAIAASLLVHLLGYLAGLLIFGIAAYYLLLRGGAYVHRLAGRMLLVEGALP